MIIGYILVAVSSFLCGCLFMNEVVWRKNHKALAQLMADSEARDNELKRLIQEVRES